MRRGPLAVRLVGMLSMIVVRRWAISCGVALEGLTRRLTVIGALVVVCGFAMAAFVESQNLPMAPSSMAFGIGYSTCMALSEASMFSAVLLMQSLGVVASRVGLKSLAVSGRLLGIGLGLPVLCILGLLCLLFGPATAVFLRAAGLSPAPAMFLVTAGILTGGAIGIGFVTFFGRVFSAHPRLRVLVMPSAIGGVAAMSLAGYLTLSAVAPELGRVTWSDMLIWPRLARIAYSGTAGGQLAALAGVLGLGVASVLTVDLALVSELGRGGQGVPVNRWHAGWMSLVRLELTRLVRTRHVRQAWYGSAIIVAGVGVWMHTQALAPAGRQVMLAIIGIFACAQTSLLARGLSDRSQPYALKLGFVAKRWAVAVAVAGSVPGWALCLPLLYEIGSHRPPAELLLVVGFATFINAWAALIGFGLHLEKNNTSGLAFAEIVLVAGGLAALWAVALPFGLVSGQAAMGLTLLVTAIALVAVIAVMEQARWMAHRCKTTEETT